MRPNSRSGHGNLDVGIGLHRRRSGAAFIKDFKLRAPLAIGLIHTGDLFNSVHNYGSCFDAIRMRGMSITYAFSI